MSTGRLESAGEIADYAEVFAALGDQTRLSLIKKLADGVPQSISRLTDDTALTRQAITKHLRVLEGAGLVDGGRVGRESQFTLRPQRLVQLRSYLDRVAAQWDDALSRLKAFVEQ